MGGIHMGFTTVSNWAACDASCRQRYWDFANTRLVPHGHQLVSHSYDHTWHLKTQDTLALILDTSQAHIEAAVPANECLFFGDHGGMWSDSMIKNGPFYTPLEPQPLMHDSMVNYMKHQKFIGARMDRGVSVPACPGVNPGVYDPFVTTYVIWLNSGPSEITQLQTRVQCAIDNGGHLNYEFHNIGELVSWSPVGYGDWVTILDYLRSKVDAGELWVETVQRVTKYMMERETYTVSVVSEDATTMEIQFNTSAEVNPSPMVDNSYYNEPLTLLITTPHGRTAMATAAPLGAPVLVEYNTGGVTLVTQDGVELYPTQGQVPVRQAAAVPRTPREGVTLLPRGTSVWVANELGSAISLRVYSLSGACVLKSSAAPGATSLDMSFLSPGLYTVVAGRGSAAVAARCRVR